MKAGGERTTPVDYTKTAEKSPFSCTTAGTGRNFIIDSKVPLKDRPLRLPAAMAVQSQLIVIGSLTRFQVLKSSISSPAGMVSDHLPVNVFGLASSDEMYSSSQVRSNVASPSFSFNS